MTTGTTGTRSGRCLWLNLDAELELENPAQYRSTSRMRAHIASRANAIQHRLSRRPDTADVVVRYDGDTLGKCAAKSGMAWCPTPSACDALLRLGVVIPAPPKLEVLQAVNHRAFCADLGQFLPGARFVRSREEADEVLTGPATLGWLLKRPFGFSGRARKRVSDGTRLTAADTTWIEASMMGHGVGLQIEPFVEIVREYAVHGYVTTDGRCDLAGVTRLVTDTDGAWLRNEPLARGDDPEHRDALLESATLVARALARTGYFGPFGIDAFSWRDARGREHLQPRSEINARYTMGYW